MEMNEFENEILSMLQNNSVDIARIDFLLKNGANINRRENEHFIPTDTEYFVSDCFWDADFSSVDLMPVLKCFIDNGFDLATYGTDLLGTLCFVYEVGVNNLLSICLHILEEMKRFNSGIDEYYPIYEKRDFFSWGTGFITKEQRSEGMERIVRSNYENLIPLFVEDYVNKKDVVGISSFESILNQEIIDVSYCGQYDSDSSEQLTRGKEGNLVFVTKETNFIVGRYGAMYLDKNLSQAFIKSKFIENIRLQLVGASIIDFERLLGPMYRRFIIIHFSNKKKISIEFKDYDVFEIIIVN